MSSKRYLSPSEYSNFEHTCSDRTPYCYLVGWSSLGIYYYGKRTRKGCHPTDLFVSYFTSSKKVKEYIKTYGSPDIIQIRKIFNDTISASEWENCVLRRLNAARNKKFLNQTNGDKSFDNTGYVSCIDIKSENKVRIPTEEFSKNRHLYKSHIDGHVFCIDIKTGNNVKVLVDEFNQNRHLYKGYSEGYVNCIEINSDKLTTISVDEFNKNRHLYKSHIDDLVICIEIESGNSITVSTEEFNKNRHLYKAYTENRVIVINIDTGEKFTISKEDFDSPNLPKNIKSVSKDVAVIVDLETGEKIFVQKGTEIDRTKYKFITGKPLGTKESDSTRKQKSESAKLKLTIKHIESGKCVRLDKDDALKLIESGEYYYTTNNRNVSPESRKKASESNKEQARINRVCDIETRKEYSTSKFLAKDKIKQAALENNKINRVCRLRDRREMSTKAFLVALNKK